MKKTLSISLVAACFCLLSGFSVRHFYHTQNKHTGPIVISGHGISSGCAWFIRPNKELFEACFDNPPEWFQNGMPLDDLVYTDDNADTRHFIKAVLKR